MSNPSAGGTFESEALLDYDALRPQIYINGELIDYCYVRQIMDSSGFDVSRATIQLGSYYEDTTEQITLNAKSDWGELKPGARVEIKNGSNHLFLGHLGVRRDIGKENAIIWECVGDGILLQGIPIFGSFQYDKHTDTVSHCPRFPAIFNADGKRNCYLKKINDIVYPFFLPKSFDSVSFNESDYDTTDEDGSIVFWTGERILQYLHYVANVDLDGTESETLYHATRMRSILNSNRIAWNIDTCKFTNVEMHKKFPTYSAQGKSLRQVLNEIGKLLGILSYRYDYIDGISWLVPFVTLRETGEENVGIEIPLQRSGDLLSSNGVFDFEVKSNFADCFGSVLVESSPILCEVSFEYDPAVSEQNNSLLPADTSDERIGFENIVMGDGTWAYYPNKIPNPINDETWNADVTWTICDGTGTSPKITAKSKDAIAFARRMLGKYRCAFKINSDWVYATNLHKGIGGEYPLATMLKIPRDVALEQLQHVLSWDSTSVIRQQYPIRVSLKYNDGWKSAIAEDGLAIGSDGYLYLNGLTNDYGDDLVYEGSMQVGIRDLVDRGVRINCVIPINDLRVYGEHSNPYFDFDESFLSDLGNAGGPLMYVDLGKTYVHEMQQNSNPAGAASFPKVDAPTGFDTAPLSRTLRDDRGRITGYAQTIMQRFNKPKVDSSWKIMGIRPELRAGMYYSKIKMINGVDGEKDFLLESFPESVLYNFIDQTTSFNSSLNE